jgi:hypothetical protein
LGLLLIPGIYRLYNDRQGNTPTGDDTNDAPIRSIFITPNMVLVSPAIIGKVLKNMARGDTNAVAAIFHE